MLGSWHSGKITYVIACFAEPDYHANPVLLLQPLTIFRHQFWARGTSNEMKSQEDVFSLAYGSHETGIRALDDVATMGKKSVLCIQERWFLRKA